jgi:hypothetical protein
MRFGSHGTDGGGAMTVDDIQQLLMRLGIPEPELTAALPRPVVRQDLESQFVDLPEAGAWFASGEPSLALIAVAQNQVTIAEPEISWLTPYTPVLRARYEVSRPLEPRKGLLAWLVRELERKSISRLSQFRRCSECDNTKPPEWMHDEELCQSCAAESHDIVY